MICVGSWHLAVVPWAQPTVDFLKGFERSTKTAASRYFGIVCENY